MYPYIFYTFHNIFIVKRLIITFSWSLLNAWKNDFQRKQKPSWALHLCYTSNLHYIMASYWKIQLKTFSHTFSIHFDFEITFTFRFWKSGKLWADGVNSNVVQLDETFYFLYILGMVQGVSSTSPSTIQVKMLFKN